MTKEERWKHIEILSDLMAKYSCFDDSERPYYEALSAGIKAMKQESSLDKIRAGILEEKECAYADFERYKVDYLGQDWEDVQDSLPQDDFRYGMERCIEIIDKYKSKSEDKE